MLPYFAQWESPELVEAFLTDKEDARLDPLWANSGAVSPEDYAKWAGHLCGMACLKMVLAALTQRVYPIMDLTKICMSYGGYKEDSSGKITGLYYQPAAQMLVEEFGVNGQVMTNLTAAEIPGVVRGGNFFIASVHPSIRNPVNDPPSKGGHLVLVFDADSQGNQLIFHNPSGFIPSHQAHVVMETSLFSRYFAGRGLLVKGGKTRTSEL